MLSTMRRRAWLLSCVVDQWAADGESGSRSPWARLGLWPGWYDKSASFDDRIASEVVDVAVRIGHVLTVLVLHGHVGAGRHEVPLGDDVMDRQLGGLHRAHRGHPLANSVLASHGRIADHGPGHIVRAARQESFRAACGKRGVH